MESVSALFKPFAMGKLQLKNRVVMAPMTRNFSPDNIPGGNVVDYYRRRAEGDAARRRGGGRAGAGAADEPDDRPAICAVRVQDVGCERVVQRPPSSPRIKSGVTGGGPRSRSAALVE